MPIQSFKELCSVESQELVHRLDEILGNVDKLPGLGRPAEYLEAQMLLNELARRAQEAATKAIRKVSEETLQMLSATRTMVFCTLAITFMTLIISFVTVKMASK